MIALVVKLLCGLLIGVFYTTFYGGGDTFVLFESASTLVELLFYSPLEYLEIMISPSLEYLHALENSRTAFFVRIVSILAAFSLNNYWSTSMIMSILSFVSSWKLISSIQVVFVKRSYIMASYIAFLFIPSVVLWSSGILKESITTSCVYFIVAIFIKIFHRVRTQRWEYTLTIIGIIALFMIKYYLAAVMITVLGMGLLYKRMQDRYHGQRYIPVAASALFLIVIVFIGSQFHQNLNIIHFSKIIQWNYNNAVVAGSQVHYEHINDGLAGIMKDTPIALVTGLFRPFVWEASGIFQLISGLENAVILLAFVLGVIIAISERNFWIDLSWLWVLFYAIMIAVLIALTTPNFGTLLRYRTAYIAFILYPVIVQLIQFYFKKLKT